MGTMGSMGNKGIKGNMGHKGIMGNKRKRATRKTGASRASRDLLSGRSGVEEWWSGSGKVVGKGAGIRLEICTKGARHRG